MQLVNSKVPGPASLAVDYMSKISRRQEGSQNLRAREGDCREQRQGWDEVSHVLLDEQEHRVVLPRTFAERRRLQSLVGSNELIERKGKGVVRTYPPHRA